ncbi:MAG: class I SAM-dependent methyltransferase [Desulfobacterales bacterium]|nr:class I SAM-dependent methyltransferase [Desulfobacterales bacterium]
MRSHLYSLIINSVNDHCYGNCLTYFSEGSTILDVGIGNGMMIKNFHDLIKSKKLKITGIDINNSYLNHCDNLIRNYNLENNIKIYHTPIESYQPDPDENFDFILFSMSFMLFSDQQLVIDRIKNWLKPDGKLVFFQTMYKKRFRLMEFIKPKLKYFTTISFGKVTYEKDFFELLSQNNLRISEDRLIKKEWFKGEYRMFVTAFEKVPLSPK